ncbi:MAG: dihydroorotase [Sphingopyxis sp.]|nr:dihydroorotase [Sphingopyxis sp.]
MTGALLFTNARLVDAEMDGSDTGASLLVCEGRIAAINPATADVPADCARIDCEGLYLAPALIDIGVFAADMAAFHSGGIVRAALMPDGAAPLDDPGLIERAAKSGKPDLWLHPLAAATRKLAGQELAEVGLMQRAGARAVASGRSRIADAGVMLRALSYANGLGLPFITHAEDEGLTRNAVATDGEMAFRLGLPSAPACAEAMAVARDIALAEVTGARIHFRQLTTAAAFELVRTAKAGGIAVTCGITPAHLLLSDVALGEWRSFARLSPPLRQEQDRVAACQALADGTIDIVCSGHDPRGPEDKRLPFVDAAPGMAGAQTMMALALGLVRDGVITLPRMFALMAANPAELLDINTGRLRVGAEADLMLFNPDTPWQIDSKQLPGRAANTPFDGLPVQGRALSLWKGGRQIR